VHWWALEWLVSISVNKNQIKIRVDFSKPKHEYKLDFIFVKNQT
jgi:hypothetical protein